MMETRTWEPKYDGHAPPNWRWGMAYWVLECKKAEPFSYLDGPAWWCGNEYLVEAEALNSPNDDASGDIPAFSTHGQVEGDDPRNQILSGGMTLRDYFAAAALQGLMSACDQSGRWTCVESAIPSAAKFAYDAADAMIAERSKP